MWRREAAAAAREGPRREARDSREGEREKRRGVEEEAVRAAISTIVAVYESLVERQKTGVEAEAVGWRAFMCSTVCRYVVVSYRGRDDAWFGRRSV